MDNNTKSKSLHPVWFFLLLSAITIVMSALLSLFSFQGSLTEITSTLKSTSTIITVESLISIDGFKFIFGECLNNFLKFIPLGTLIIGLGSVGVGIKVGFLKSLFSKLAKFIPRRTIFFIFALLCIIMGFSTDLGFVIMVPVAAILFTEYKRSQVVGMTMAFVATAAGSNINLFITSIDYSLIELSKPAVSIIDPSYNFVYTGNLFFIVISSLLLALVVSTIAELTSRNKPVRIGDEEIEIKEKLDKKGLKNAFIALSILIVIFVYSIIPGLPLSGALLDNSQDLYINQLFGANSPYINGIIYIVSIGIAVSSAVYGLTTKQVKNNKDLVKLFSFSLNGIGEMLLLIFAASQFVVIFKYSNIGNVISVNLFNIIKDMELSFIVLILISFIVIIISSLIVPSFSQKWTMFASSLIPVFMKSNITPEFAGGIFRLAASVGNLVSPLFAYFVVYLGFIGLYSKNDFTIRKCYKLLLPYLIAVIVLWLFIIISWYILKAPIGPNIFPTI